MIGILAVLAATDSGLGMVMCGTPAHRESTARKGHLDILVFETKKVSVDITFMVRLEDSGASHEHVGTSGMRGMVGTRVRVKLSL